MDSNGKFDERELKNGVKKKIDKIIVRKRSLLDNYSPNMNSGVILTSMRIRTCNETLNCSLLASVMSDSPSNYYSENKTKDHH